MHEGPISTRTSTRLVPARAPDSFLLAGWLAPRVSSRQVPIRAASPCLGSKRSVHELSAQFSPARARSSNLILHELTARLFHPARAPKQLLQEHPVRGCATGCVRAALGRTRAPVWCSPPEQGEVARRLGAAFWLICSQHHAPSPAGIWLCARSRACRAGREPSRGRTRRHQQSWAAQRGQEGAARPRKEQLAKPLFGLVHPMRSQASASPALV